MVMMIATIFEMVSASHDGDEGIVKLGAMVMSVSLAYIAAKD